MQCDAKKNDTDRVVGYESDDQCIDVALIPWRWKLQV